MLKRILAPLAALILAATAPAFAQVSQSDEVLTLTSQGAGTVNSSQEISLNARGVKCNYNQSSHTGTPSVTWAIQWEDPASGVWQSYVTSAAVTTDTNSTLTVYPGIAVTANVSANDILTRAWRIQVVVAGTTPVVNATVGCSQVR